VRKGNSSKDVCLRAGCLRWKHQRSDDLSRPVPRATPRTQVQLAYEWNKHADCFRELDELAHTVTMKKYVVAAWQRQRDVSITGAAIVPPNLQEIMRSFAWNNATGTMIQRAKQADGRSKCAPARWPAESHALRDPG
jgi:hypothetical protein